MEDSSSPLAQPDIPFFLPNMSNSEWRASAEFNSAGMQAVYQLANLSLSTIFPRYDQYLGYASQYDPEQPPTFDLDNFSLHNLTSYDWETLVWENRGPLGYLLGSILFILLLTLWGVGWLFSKCCCGDKGCCCLRCCRTKGRDDVISAKLEQKRDKCKRNFCGVLFATIIVVFMFGLVCCFVTNEQMRISVDSMPEDVDNSLADVNTYLNATEGQINALFVDNYKLLSSTLNRILDDSGEIIKNGLSIRTGAQTLDNLTEIVDSVDEVRENVQIVERASRGLRDKVQQLKSGLTGVKNRLLALLSNCSAPKCSELRNLPEIRSLRVQNDFQNLPDLTEILRELQVFLGNDVRDSIAEGRRRFDELGAQIKSEVEPVLPDIRNLIDDTGRDLEEVANSLTKALQSVPVDEGREEVQGVEREIKKYAPLRYYAVLGVCLTLAFIFTLLTLGIFVGFCGRQPGSDYSNECCSRKTGSSFINCGIFFIFLTGGILMSVSILHFILAGTLTQVICEAVKAQDNRTQEAFRLPTLRIDSKYNYQVPPYHEILGECKRGGSVYQAFQLQPVYDIEKIMHLADRFKRKAKHLASQVTLPSEATENIQFLTPEAKAQLTAFSRSKIARLKFDSFASQLEESIVSVDLKDVIARFNESIQGLESSPELDELKSQLQVEIIFLETFQEKLLAPMVNDVQRAAESLRFLSAQQKDLARKVQSVAEAAEAAQKSLQTSSARQEVRKLAHEYEGAFLKHVEHYANFTYTSIRDHVGECSPLYHSLNATTTTFCHKLGSPLAAFWFSLTSLLILFVPLLMVGMTLARLYKKYKYLGYESDTYYSSYGDGDTIPLSLSANGRRQKRGREPGVSSRYQNRFEDTSQNTLESVLRSSPEGRIEEPPPIGAGRPNLRFIDSPSLHERFAGITRRKDSALVRSSADGSAPPPPYSEAVRYSQLSSVQEEWDWESTGTATSSEQVSSSGAWGSQLVFNNHHTPPASGEYERPPPYYYPGPAH